MKNLMIICLSLIGFQASAMNIINCLDKAAARSYKSVCQEVIDTNKLVYINCFDKSINPEEARLCANITIPTEKGDALFNCVGFDRSQFNDPYLIDRCARLPNPKTVYKTDCWGSDEQAPELEDGYQVNLCENVDTVEQDSVHKKLLQQK